LEGILNSLNNVSRGDQRVGHNWGKYFIGLFHVSEHLGHFKAIFFNGKTEIVGGYLPPPSLVKDQTISVFSLAKASLIYTET
jgi:hypothetical protein